MVSYNVHPIDGAAAEKVTNSPKFQVVIPRSVRERLNLRPGQQIQVIPYEDRIELVPLRPARELRGSLRGLPTDLLREPDRLLALATSSAPLDGSSISRTLRTRTSLRLPSKILTPF